jgi:hypothetical protein
MDPLKDVVLDFKLYRAIPINDLYMKESNQQAYDLVTLFQICNKFGVIQASRECKYARGL